MDSVLSWFMAVVLSLVGSVWFMCKAEQEREQNKRENEDFFIRKEIYDNYRKNHRL